MSKLELIKINLCCGIILSCLIGCGHDSQAPSKSVKTSFLQSASHLIEIDTKTGISKESVLKDSNELDIPPRSQSASSSMFDGFEKSLSDVLPGGSIARKGISIKGSDGSDNYVIVGEMYPAESGSDSSIFITILDSSGEHLPGFPVEYAQTGFSVQAHDVIEADDGNLVLACSRHSSQSTNSVAFLLRLSKSGSNLNSWITSHSGFGLNAFYAVTQMPSGDLVTVGVTEDSNFSGVIGRIPYFDENYADDVVVNSSEFLGCSGDLKFYDVIAKDASHVLIAGQGKNCSTGKSEMLVLEYDTNTLERTGMTQIPMGSVAYSIAKMEHTNGSGYVVAGRAESSPGDEDAILVTLDQEGVLQDSYLYGGAGKQSALGVIASPYGFAIAGYNRNQGSNSKQGYYVQAGFDGNTSALQHEFFGNGTQAQALSLERASHHRTLITGYEVNEGGIHGYVRLAPFRSTDCSIEPNRCVQSEYLYTQWAVDAAEDGDWIIYEQTNSYGGGIQVGSLSTPKNDLLFTTIDETTHVFMGSSATGESIFTLDHANNIVIEGDIKLDAYSLDIPIIQIGSSASNISIRGLTLLPATANYAISAEGASNILISDISINTSAFGYGISLNSVSNATIENSDITGFFGIYSNGSGGVTIQNNKINRPYLLGSPLTSKGIHIYGGGNVIRENTIGGIAMHGSGFLVGLHLEPSYNNQIVNNTFRYNETAMDTTCLGGCTISGNIIIE